MSHCTFHSYRYNTIVTVFQNGSVNVSACVGHLGTEVAQIQTEPSVEDNKGTTVDCTEETDGLTGSLKDGWTLF